MPLFNFQKQFADAVERGEKRQTIRARRKNRPKVGQIAHLYTGARTKACRKLGESKIICVREVCIKKTIVIIGTAGISNLTQLNCFAKDDGFNSWDDMRDWFEKTHGLPFVGDLIRW